VANSGRDWRSRAAAVTWWPIALFAVLALGSAVSTVVDHDDGWGVQAVEALVLGVLALGIALDLRHRARRDAPDLSRHE
jgi:hypothetical protein